MDPKDLDESSFSGLKLCSHLLIRLLQMYGINSLVVPKVPFTHENDISLCYKKKKEVQNLQMRMY